MSLRAQRQADFQQQQLQHQHEMLQTKQKIEHDAKNEIDTINQQATNALSVKVQENEQLQRESERMMREA